jgi:glycosyltransferase involved in cell wall biosynthesis
VLVDPYDVGSIVDGLRRVLTDPARAEEMRRKGLIRAREFSWERSVAKTLEVYRRFGAPAAAVAAI